MAYTGTATIGAILLSQGNGIPPIWSSPMTNGQLIIGNTGHIPTLSTLTAGTGISVTNAAGSITITNTSPGTPITVTQYDVLVGGAANTIVSVGPGSSGQILQSGGASSNPAYSTTTYPATNAINTLLYASSANVMSALATATTAVLTTAAGVPTWASELSLALGGTNADLTASNGGIFYSTASAGAILSGTATAKQMLQSGSSTAPTWSTSTYPSTNAVNTLLYASAANVMSALATVTTAVLTTSAGVPTWATELSLALGGTNANLTASNGGIFYSTASAGAILAGTSTAGQLLLSGSSTAPTWSTSTYPSTNAVNTLLYASSANTMAALATADNGVLITSASGVPSILADGTTGQVLTATTGSPPSWAAAPFVPSPCYFSAFLDKTYGPETGDGTQFIVPFGSTLSNVGSAYNTTTGVFTAPTTGFYQFNTSIAFGMISASNQVVVTFNGSVYNARGFQDDPVASSGDIIIACSIAIPMTAGDTMSIIAAAYGGTKSVNIVGNPPSSYAETSTFSGWQIA